MFSESSLVTALHNECSSSSSPRSGLFFAWYSPLLLLVFLHRPNIPLPDNSKSVLFLHYPLWIVFSEVTFSDPPSVWRVSVIFLLDNCQGSSLPHRCDYSFSQNVQTQSIIFTFWKEIINFSMSLTWRDISVFDNCELDVIIIVFQPIKTYLFNAIFDILMGLLNIIVFLLLYQYSKK